MVWLVGFLALLNGAWAQEAAGEETSSGEETPAGEELAAEEDTQASTPATEEASASSPTKEESTGEPTPDSAAGDSASEPVPDSGVTEAESEETTTLGTSAEVEEANLSPLEARAMYQLGLGLAAKQMWNEACAVYDRIADQHGDTEYATRAAEQRSMIAQMPGLSACGTAAFVSGRGFDLSGTSGDVELVVSQAIAGTAFGAGLPSLLIPNGMTGELVAASTLVGLGSGLAGSMLVSKKYDVTEGQAMAVFTGEYLGAWNGGALSAILFPFGPPSPAAPLQYAMTGFLVGGAAGTAAAIYLEPSAADMALVRSGASWGTGMAALSFTIFYGGEMRGDFTRLLVGTDLGLLTGVILADRIDVSRGRMNLINLSGYAGGVVAFGVLGTLGLDGVESPVVGGSILVLSGVGLGVGAHLTRKMDLTDHGGTAGVGAEYRDGRWRFGMPIPTVVPVRAGEYGIRLPLASGTF